MTIRAESMATELGRMTEQAEQLGANPVLVCSPALRAPLRRMIRVALPRLPVLSYTEIAGTTLRVEAMGVVSGAYPVAA